jgi:hypothetical protein
LTLVYAAAGLVVLSTGCSTSFKYTPSHEQTYAPIANQAGLAIRSGQDSRPPEERRPAWTKNAGTIAARALADEVRNAKLFHLVKIHADRPDLKKYSEVVQFRVLKFECYNRPVFLEGTWRELLGYSGIRGALIEKSIPSKYVAEVEIEFEVLNARQTARPSIERIPIMSGRSSC